MLQEFITSFPLFFETYLSALFMAIFLSIIGILVVNREQIFLTAAISQAATLGLAIDILLNLQQPMICAVVLSILAAVVSGRKDKRGGSNREEFSAWVFLVSASLSVLLLSNHPQGIKQIQASVASSIIGSGIFEVVVFAIISVFVAAVCLIFNDKLRLFVMDPIMAAAVGIPIVLWGWYISLFLGFSIGMAMCSSGMLYTFGCVVLPAQIAKTLCQRLSYMFIVSPIVAVISVVCGLIFANHYNYPPGQMVIALMGMILVVSWMIQWLRTKA
ncbi:metal ABC transporter permease [Candidatus Uabimicrobium amorphum]|uniref:Membrane protein n=1 Tax=Uabimicrobium amorphum TaxID=2596890 RepID=A0A5S9III3_UABAM|nr:metal ABC transporter permease [Candidatus Uabimicrobium amorphum]BBM82468.1 membrane protein [Candidatus Uabimicrobium amorphum]